MPSNIWSRCNSIIKAVSDGFYSERGGYKLRLKVSSKNSDNVGVYINLMPGPNDNALQFPMRGKFTITLLNQIEDRNHCQSVLTLREMTDNAFTRKFKANYGDGWGFPKFIRHSSLPFNPDTNTQYLKDCTLYFRVKCEPSSPQAKPWLIVNEIVLDGYTI